MCTCTFRRPELLGLLLARLATQKTGRQFTFSVVVSDNDRGRSAERVVAEQRKTAAVPIEYCVEPEQNIALARNQALAHATGDFIAFIDDDELPEPDWLARLYESCVKFAAAGVLGPVKPYFKEPPPAWVIEGKFYERPTHETGFVVPLNEGRTGNLLFRRAILDGMDEVFRREFGGGGEDRDFFRRVMGQGHVFVWCNEAVVHELVPPNRWKRSFMIKRALLRGKMSLNHPGMRGVGIAKSLVAIGAYSASLPVMFLLGHHHFMNYTVKLFDHAGRVLAFLGLSRSNAYVTE